MTPVSGFRLSWFRGVDLQCSPKKGMELGDAPT